MAGLFDQEDHHSSPALTKECTASAWSWASVCIATSTLIWPCWTDGAAAAKEPIRRAITAVSRIVQLGRGVTFWWFFLYFFNIEPFGGNLSLKEKKKIVRQTLIEVSRYGRKWKKRFRGEEKGVRVWAYLNIYPCDDGGQNRGLAFSICLCSPSPPQHTHTYSHPYIYAWPERFAECCKIWHWTYGKKSSWVEE